MKKILVTGGMGYIGSHTVVQLYEAGYEPIIVDNLVNSKPEVLNRIEKITGKRPLFYEFDVRDEENMNKIFDENDIFAVIHFAGLKSVGESVQKPQLYFDNNIGSTEVAVCGGGLVDRVLQLEAFDDAVRGHVEDFFNLAGDGAV